MSRELLPIAGLNPPKVLRYQMPPLQSKLEGGRKTLLPNLSLVAKALHRSAEEIIKFYGFKYSAKAEFASTSVNVKGKASPPVGILKTVRVTPQLQDDLKEYIEEYVLCSHCYLPETHYIASSKHVYQQCASCHTETPLNMTKKLSQYIYIQVQRKEEHQKLQGIECEAEQNKYWGKGNNGLVFYSEVSLMTEILPRKDHSSSPDVNLPQPEMKSEEEECQVVERSILGYQSYINEHPSATIAEQMEELKHLQTMASLRPADRCVIYLGAVFTENAITQNEVEKHQEMLSSLAASEIQQRHLLAAVEWFCGSRFPALLRLFPKLLMQLYEAEIVEEDIFLAWAGDTTRNEFTVDISLLSFETLESLHNAAAPFIKWLQEAEEEEDGEEDGEEEEDEEEETSSGK